MIEFLKGCIELLAVILLIYFSLLGLTIVVAVLNSLGHFSFVIAIFIIVLIMIFLGKQVD